MNTLQAYAEDHGANEQDFIDAGWREGTYYSPARKAEFPALLYDTATGTRARFIDKEAADQKYGSPTGYKQCWYRLDEAVGMIEGEKAKNGRTELALILCNGEASTVAAQARGLPATCITSGEKRTIPTDLLRELLLKYPYHYLYIVADNDETGRNFALGVAEQLKNVGITVCKNQVDGEEGADLADFCKERQDYTPVELVHDIYSSLPFVLTPEEIAKREAEAAADAAEGTAYTDPETGELLSKQAAMEAFKQRVAYKLDWEEIASRLGDIGETDRKGWTRILGNGGTFFNEDRQCWNSLSREQGGDVLDFIGISLYGIDAYSRYDKEMFKAVLNEAYKLTGVQAPMQNKPQPTAEAIEKERSGKVSEVDGIAAALEELDYSFHFNDLTKTVDVHYKNAASRLDDFNAAEMRVELNRYGFKNRQVIDDVIFTEARKKIYHPIKDYLNTLPEWDGVDRIAQVANCLNPDSQNNVAYIWLKRWMVGTVGKALDNRQSIMLVIEGAQGNGKSTFVHWLCPLKEYFVEGPIDPSNKDHELRLSSLFMWEVGELGATTRKADVESLKEFITRRNVRVRPAYGRFELDKPAVASMIGTVNDNGAGFLVDDTGNRRFMIIATKKIDFSYQEIDLAQLWSQAVTLYKRGEPGIPTAEEATIQEVINDRYKVDNPVEDGLSEHFEATADGFVSSSELLQRMRAAGLNGSDDYLNKRISAAVSAMGGEKGKKGGKRGFHGIAERAHEFAHNKGFGSLR